MEQPSTQYPPVPPVPPVPPAPPFPPSPAFPLTFSVAYPEKLDRLSSFFRGIWAIPILVILGLLGYGTYSSHGHAAGWGVVFAGGVLFAPVLLMLLFRKKYPRWWFDWNLQFTKFSTRVLCYLELLRDEYPSTDEEQAARVDFSYPDAQQLSRGLPLVKWFLAIPHYIVLWFLWIATAVCVVIAWFAILFTGKYPRSLFDFVVGVNRWTLRVSAYAALLITDQYPPFSLD